MRRSALDAFGRALFASLKREGVPEGSVLATDAELDVLLQPPGARLVRGLRGGTVDVRLTSAAAPTRLAFQNARYAGVCLQGSRDEAAGTAPFPLRERGWVMERLLVAGDDMRAGRIAAWVEGTFILTDRGIVAIEISRVETPRQRHADLEMGACDMRVGLDDHNM